MRPRAAPTTFRVLLPMLQRHDGEAPASRANKSRPRSMPNGHILVADDDAAIRTVLNQGDSTRR